MSDPSPAQPPSALIRALMTLLRPLVQLMMRFGITFPQLAELLKRVYVDVAARELTNEVGRKPSQSRISLQTGVHRKDVKRLLSRDDAPAAALLPSLGARIVGVWAGSEAFSDLEGHPMPLPRRSDDPGEPSFETLVRSVSTDLRPRAVLDEWQRLQVVRIDDEDRVHLNAEAFVPRDGFDQTAHFFGRNLRDHVAAASENLAGKDPAFLERAVFYDRLSPDSVKRLEQLARKLGSDALLRVNREALRLSDNDQDNGNAGRRMTFGVYFYEAPDDGSPDEDDRHD